MLIVDDVTTFGKGVADNFQKKWEELGGTVADRVGAPPDTTDFNGIITAAKAKNPDGVYYGGVVTSGAGLLLKQMRQQGLNIPFTGPDGIVNGPGDAEGSLIQIAGKDNAAGSYGTIAAIGDFPGKADFEAAYRRALQERRRLQDPRRVQRSRVRLHDGHPEVARGVPEGESGRRPGGHPRGRPRLGG